MRFEEALKAMREGKKVKLKNHISQYEIAEGKIWQRVVNFYAEKYSVVNNGFACIDILSEDWEIAEDEQKS